MALQRKDNLSLELINLKLLIKTSYVLIGFIITFSQHSRTDMLYNEGNYGLITGSEVTMKLILSTRIFETTI